VASSPGVPCPVPQGMKLCFCHRGCQCAGNTWRSFSACPWHFRRRSAKAATIKSAKRPQYAGFWSDPWNQRSPGSLDVVTTSDTSANCCDRETRQITCESLLEGSNLASYLGHGSCDLSVRLHSQCRKPARLGKLNQELSPLHGNACLANLQSCKSLSPPNEYPIAP